MQNFRMRNVFTNFPAMVSRIHENRRQKYPECKWVIRLFNPEVHSFYRDLQVLDYLEHEPVHFLLVAFLFDIEKLGILFVLV